jgi:hypothetical protein
MGIFVNSSQEQNDARKSELRRRLKNEGFTGSAQTTEEKTIRNESADRKKQSIIETFMSKEKTDASLDAVEARAAREEAGQNPQELEEIDASNKRRRRRLRRRQKG